MDAKRWGQINEIYDRALDLCGDERAGFLAEACGDDADLRREVESLLAAGFCCRVIRRSVKHILPKGLQRVRYL